MSSDILLNIFGDMLIIFLGVLLHNSFDKVCAYIDALYVF